MRLLSLFIVLIWVSILVGCTSPGDDNAYTMETLILDLASDGEATTVNSYVGWVTIEVVGSGYINDAIQIDAFYTFTENGGLINRPDERYSDWRFIINDCVVLLYISCAEPGNPPDLADGNTRFNEDHHYRFGYLISSETPQTLTFFLGDSTQDDNQGQVDITVSTEPLFTGR